MRIPALAVCLLMSAAGAWGQAGPSDPPPAAPAPRAAPEDQAQDPPEPGHRVEGPVLPTFIYTLGQRVESGLVPHIDGGGKATTSLARTEFGLTWLASQRTRAILNVSNEFAHYDFDNAYAVDPVEGEPFGSFNRQNIDLVVSHNLTSRWVVLGVGGVGLARERNAHVGDAVVWRAGVGASYYATRDISLGVSVLATSRLEGGVRILPLPQVDATIRLDDAWTLKLATIDGVTLAYRATDELAFELNAGYQERQYRLDDAGFAPGGVFQDRSIDLGLGVNWRPAEGLEVRAGVGSQLWRRFEIKGEDGVRLSRAETDPTLMLHAGVSYRF